MTEPFTQLNAFIQQKMDETGVPGVAIGILHQGNTETAGFGITNTDHPLPVTDDTLFQIGSITKTFTTTAMMRLIEKGKLSLDDRVRTLLPDFKVLDETAAASVTIRHLLTHMANWAGDYFIDTGAGDDAGTRYAAAMAELEQVAPLGTAWSYNNAGFYLAGHIIERLTGQSYQAALRELVLDPLGLERIYFDAGDVITHRFVAGHKVTDEGPEVQRPWGLPRAAYPTGGIITDVKTLLRYAQFQLGDGATAEGTRLLQPETMKLMQSPQVAIWGGRSMGLSWFIDDIEGVRRLSHGGGTKGQISLLMLVPDHDFAIAVFTNAEQGGFITHDAAPQALELYLGLETPQPQPIDASAEQLAAYAGRYVRPYQDVELYLEDGQLMIQFTQKLGFPDRNVPPGPPPPPMRVALCEEDRLLVLDGPAKDSTAEIIRNADGSIGWLRIGRLHRKGKV